MKDNFSSGSDLYARYRPTYPAAVFEYLYSLLSSFENAWDCGTGTGQVAHILSQRFAQVFASDISENQIAHAAPAPNIHYSIQDAAAPSFPPDTFDLITVAQAIHWFDFEKFYAGVRSVARQGALIAAMGYGLLSINKPVDAWVQQLYRQVLGNYWDKERRFVDEDYQTIPFPFQEEKPPEFVQKYLWSRQHFLGYVHTWSAYKHFVQKNAYDPVAPLLPQLSELWPADEQKEVRFPILLRAGRVHSR